MIAEPIERRSSKRFTVEADRAEVVVNFDGADHRAIISDMSSTGFGLLLLKGLRIVPGCRVQLTDTETQTVFQLEVVYVRPEESFQYVGLRRMSDETPHSIPLFRFAGKMYTLPVPSFSPLLYVAVVLGFSGTSITMIELITGGGDSARPTRSSSHRQASSNVSQQVSPAEKRQRLLERSKRRHTNQLVDRSEIQITPGFWERITGPSREQVGRLVGNRKISWSELVTQLSLSEAQQDRIQGLLGSDDDEKVQAARAQMMTLLTDEQRSAFNQLLATLPLN